MSSPLAAQYRILWSISPDFPDLVQFLALHPPATNEELVLVVLVDQQLRWGIGEPISVEEYLRLIPQLAETGSARLELEVGECLWNPAKTNDNKADSSLLKEYPELAQLIQALLAQPTAVNDGASGALGSDLDLGNSTTQMALQNFDIRLGRYRLIRILGDGAFGRVWLANDEELRRQVAIKVPLAKRLEDPKAAELYLTEARTVANLKHPNIVAIFDVGRTDTGVIYVVSEFVNGETLETELKRGLPSIDRTTAVLRVIASALGHAHQLKIVHRDVKPSNVLVESPSGTPFLADFGLAIRVEESQFSGTAGSPVFMSPEQARQGGHRLDGRSDLFSLGVVFYEMLTGTRPFMGKNINETFQLIINTNPIPPRYRVPTIPAELERICLKLLAKIPNERYQSSDELIADLEKWNNPVNSMNTMPESDVRSQQLIPRGLQSYTADDAGYFLELLPGIKDRDGLPQSVSFWKTRLEEADSDKTFGVGLLYGPSGCGKSSLMKAGLIPRLERSICAIYLEATPNDTEARILRELRNRIADLPPDLDLVATLKYLRLRSPNAHIRKVVIVLDQFEQWLFSHRPERNAPLINALWHCDGGRVQSVIMVRDDFAMAADRFMNAIDTPTLKGENFATVDLFSIDHAKQVLVKFGRALEKLPQEQTELTSDQQQFIEQAVAGLSVNEQVISVRLALFAEMVREKPWTPKTLIDVGGTEGIGVNYLETTFSARSANPRYRAIQEPVRAVLKALLPAMGTDIKGNMRSRSELADSAGLPSDSPRFETLLQALSNELKLISVSESESHTTSEPQNTLNSSTQPTTWYQLTHDYLVPSLREWLTRKQKETRQGRAELLLAERTSLWTVKPQNRYLPALGEHLRIRWLTDRKKRTQAEQQMLSQAARVHSARSAIGVVVVLVLLVVGLFVNRRIQHQRDTDATIALVEQIVSAEPSQRLPLIERLDIDSYRSLAAPILNTRLDSALAENETAAIIPLRMALLSIHDDVRQIEPLRQALVTTTPAQFPGVRDTLGKRHQNDVVEALWDDALAESSEGSPAGSAAVSRKLQAACALATFAPDDARWNRVAPFVAEQLVQLPAAELIAWRGALQPARHHLQQPLLNVFAASPPDSSARQLATGTLTDFARDNVTVIAEAVITADPKSFERFLPVAEANRDVLIPVLERELEKTLEPSWNDPPLDPSWNPAELRLVERIRAADGLVDERFAICLSLPVSEFVELCEELRPTGYRPISFAIAKRGETDVVSVIWSRDGHDWKLAGPIDRGEVAAVDESVRKTGLRPLLPPRIIPVGPGVFVLWGPAMSQMVEPELGAAEESRIAMLNDFVPIPSKWQLKVYRFDASKTPKSPPDSVKILQSEPIATLDVDQVEFFVTKPKTNAFEDVLMAFETTLQLQKGSYQVWVQVDVGARISVDGDVVIDRWATNDGNPEAKAVQLASGSHVIRVEYFHRTGDVAMQARFGFPGIMFQQPNASVESTDVKSAIGRFERELVSDGSPQELLATLHAKRRDGFRPSQISFSLSAEAELMVDVWLRRPSVPEDARDALASRQSHATVALARLGRSDVVWPQLSFRPDPNEPATQDPRRRTEILLDLATYNVDWRTLVARLKELQSGSNGADVSICRALLMALGRYTSAMAPADRDQVVTDLGLVALYESDPDQGIHGALEWLLRTWNKNDEINAVKGRLSSSKNRPATPVESANRTWFVNSQGQTFSVFNSGEFLMGSPENEPKRIPDETRHRRLIERRFAIATTEVTREQFLAYAKATGRDDKTNPYVKTLDSPQTRWTWFEAARYCNWLTDQEGLKRCYIEREKGGKLVIEREKDFLERDGYRLPTEAEWEYACRAGAATSRYYGIAERRLSEFAWYLDYSSDRTWPVGQKLPNDAGLFDMLGNAMEWCHDAALVYPTRQSAAETLTDTSVTTDTSLRRVLRGGSFDDSSSIVRSSGRVSGAPDYDNVTVSFRPSRTYR